MREDVPIIPEKDNYTEERGKQARIELDAVLAERRKEIESGDLSKESERRYIDRLNAINQRMVDDFIAHSKEKTQTFKSAEEALRHLGDIW